MVRRASRAARVLASAALVLALAAAPSARCFADSIAGEAKVVCCAAMEHDCHHDSAQLRCCIVNMPDHDSPALALRIDHGKPPVIALLTLNAVWLWPASSAPAHADNHAVPARSGRPTYLLVSAFRI